MAFLLAFVYLNSTNTIKTQIARCFDILSKCAFEIFYRSNAKRGMALPYIGLAAVRTCNNVWVPANTDKLNVCVRMTLEHQAFLIRKPYEEPRGTVKI